MGGRCKKSCSFTYASVATQAAGTLLSCRTPHAGMLRAQARQRGIVEWGLKLSQDRTILQSAPPIMVQFLTVTTFIIL